MMKTGNVTPNALHDDQAKRELLDMLQVIIAEGGGLATIRLILDEAKSMPDIRARFASWQSNRHAALSATTASTQTIPPSSDPESPAKFTH